MSGQSTPPKDAALPCRERTLKQSSEVVRCPISQLHLGAQHQSKVESKSTNRGDWSDAHGEVDVKFHYASADGGGKLGPRSWSEERGAHVVARRKSKVYALWKAL